MCAFAGIVVYIFTACMKKFARCGCVQGILKGTPCGSCVESCGKCGMLVGVGLSAGAFLVSFVNQ